MLFLHYLELLNIWFVPSSVSEVTILVICLTMGEEDTCSHNLEWSPSSRYVLTIQRKYKHLVSSR